MTPSVLLQPTPEALPLRLGDARIVPPRRQKHVSKGLGVILRARLTVALALVGVIFPAVPYGQQQSLGAIAGHLSFPSDCIPPLRVCALSTTDPSRYQCVITGSEQKTYRIDSVHPDDYYVLVYRVSVNRLESRNPGAYSRMVLCGLKKDCTDHALIPVTITAGKTVNDINPADWYAPPNAFPVEPPR